MPTDVLSTLRRILDQAYEKKAWHGPNLRGSLRGIEPALAAWRPAPSRRNIWEIAVHAAYWKYAVRRRLLGEKRGSFPLQGSNWFPRPQLITLQAWNDDLDLLHVMHRSLRAAVEALRPADLAKMPKRSKVTNLDTIWGIAAHDVYHAGQIQVLKRLAGRSS